MTDWQVVPAPPNLYILQEKKRLQVILIAVERTEMLPTGQLTRWHTRALCSGRGSFEAGDEGMWIDVDPQTHYFQFSAL